MKQNQRRHKRQDECRVRRMYHCQIHSVEHEFYLLTKGTFYIKRDKKEGKKGQ
jgi:hypothetical protein